MRLSEIARVTGSIGDEDSKRDDASPRIGHMYFGATDANNEYLQIGDERFLRLFCANPRFDVQKVLDGSITFICGNKGTGKTMFLRYTELMAKKDACPTAFVKYRRQVTNVDKKMLRQAARSSEEEVVDDVSGAVSATLDYVLGWQLYLIKVIVFLIRSSESNVFVRDSEGWGRITRLLDDVYGDQGQAPNKRLLPKITKGQVKVKTKHVRFALGFEPKSSGEDCKISFAELAQGVVDMYADLACGEDAVPVYVFIDEIELAFGQKREYERNVTLVRDLILAVTYLNDIARESGFPVRIIAALRNEVFQSVKNAGYELNKPIEDYGVQIDWRTATGDIADNPLIRIVEKRIAHNVPSIAGNSDFVWSYFFPGSIDGMPTKNYVLNQTWSKPRDIVRLLTTLQEHCGDEERFNEQVFFAIRRDYSKRAWGEIEEELRTNYSEAFVDGIRKILSGITCPFSMDDLRAKVERESNLFESAAKALEGKTLPEFIEVLFKFGIIGNIKDKGGSYGRARFMAYGEDEPDLFGMFTVHYPLRSMFDVRVDEGRKASIKR